MTELERMRAENERLRAEVEPLKEQCAVLTIKIGIAMAETERAWSMYQFVAHRSREIERERNEAREALDARGKVAGIAPANKDKDK